MVGRPFLYRLLSGCGTHWRQQCNSGVQRSATVVFAITALVVAFAITTFVVLVALAVFKIKIEPIVHPPSASSFCAAVAAAGRVLSPPPALPQHLDLIRHGVHDGPLHVLQHTVGPAVLVTL
jgi:hypothetical protein